MKKNILALAFAVALFVAAPARSQDVNCEQSGENSGENAGCTVKTPEPTSSVLLGSGIFAVGGMLLLLRKRLAPVQ